MKAWWLAIADSAREFRAAMGTPAFDWGMAACAWLVVAALAVGVVLDGVL